MTQVPTFNVWVGPWRQSWEKDSVILSISEAGSSLRAHMEDADLIVVDELKFLLESMDLLPHGVPCIYTSPDETGAQNNWFYVSRLNEIGSYVRLCVLTAARQTAKLTQA